LKDVVSGQRERAKKFGHTEHFTLQELIALYDSHGNKCLRCGTTDFQYNPLVPDHVVSLAQGGSNTIDNIQPLCRKCNSSKKSAGTDYRPAAEGMPIAPGDLFTVNGG